MILSKGYDEKYPSESEKNITSFISLEVYDIVDVDELHMSYTVHFKIELKWFDSRIIFRNLNIGLLQIATELILAVKDPVETSPKFERSNWLQLMCGLLPASTTHGVLQLASNICPQASITCFNGNSINVNSN